MSLVQHKKLEQVELGLKAAVDKLIGLGRPTAIIWECSDGIGWH